MDLAYSDVFLDELKKSQQKNKIKKLIDDVLRHPFSGLGKPEPLKYEFSGLWSRRIDQKNRLIYSVKNNMVLLISCAGHYK